jgi:hypothetical protein
MIESGHLQTAGSVCLRMSCPHFTDLLHAEFTSWAAGNALCRFVLADAAWLGRMEHE